MSDIKRHTPTDFESVFKTELKHIGARRKQTGSGEEPVATVIPKKYPDGSDDLEMSNLTGVAMSGGGIRSSAFCLGALQAMDALVCKVRRPGANRKDKTLFEAMDYMSTVSGGGYTGSAISAAMIDSAEFPLQSRLERDESPAMRHIRDHSNYMFPRGGLLEKAENLGVMLRGIIAHLPVVLSVLMVLVCVSVLSNQYIYLLGHALLGSGAMRGELLSFSPANLALWTGLSLICAYLMGWGPFRAEDDKTDSPNPGILYLGFGFLFFALIAVYTVIPDFFIGLFRISLLLLVLLVVVLLFLGAWRSYKPETEREIGRRNTIAVAWFIILIFFSGFANLQPFLVDQIHETYVEAKHAKDIEDERKLRLALAKAKGPTEEFIVEAEILEEDSKASNDKEGGLVKLIFNSVNYMAGLLSTIAGVVAAISAFFGRGEATENKQTGLIAILLRNSKNISLFLAGLALPFVFWFLYLNLSYIGIMANEVARNSVVINQVYYPDWLKSLIEFSNLGIENPAQRVPPLFLVVTAFMVLYSLTLLRNRNSLHGLYKDRLSQAFIACKETSKLHPKLSELNTANSPFHLINAALNIQGSEAVNQRGRNAEFFTFSRSHIGSDATQYAQTEALEERETDVTLGTAMAISAAAASTAMGSMTMRPLALTLAVFNIRLGYWLRNPQCIRENSWFALFIQRVIEMPYYYLTAEITGMLDEDRGLVYLTDGGHLENLGLYTLLKRRCKFIVVIDGEADPEWNFSSFVTAQRYARVDLGTRIELPLDNIRRVSRTYREYLEDRKTAEKDREPFLEKGPHCSLGVIHYPDDAQGNAQTGTILYIKSSITGDENDYVSDYARRHPTFPHETTGDQFFSEEQYEAYRSLGFHAAFGALRGANDVDTAAGSVRLTTSELSKVKRKFRGQPHKYRAIEDFLEMFPNIRRR